MSDFGLSADGYTAPRAADYLTQIRDQYEEELVALGYTVLPDWDRDLFLGTTSEIMANLLGELAQTNQAVYDARSPSNATGLQLGNLALIVGVTRLEASKGTVVLRCTGTDGKTITQGKLCEGGGPADATRWVCTEDGTIGDVTTGYVDLTFECEDAGELVATPGEITTIVTPVDGWDSVTNLAAADPGRARETDGELRARRQRALQAAGSSSTNAIRAALLDLSFIRGAVVVDNKTGASVTDDGVTLDPYSVACVIAPNTLTDDDLALVVRAIYDHLGCGTATSGTETGTVTKRDGRSETINYYVAADTAVNVAWTVVLEPGYLLADVEDPLALAVADYFLTLAPGDTVYPMPLIAIAATIAGIKNVTTLLLNGGAIPVDHDATELPVLGTHSVA